MSHVWTRTSMSPPRDMLTVNDVQLYNVEWSHWDTRWRISSIGSGYVFRDTFRVRDDAKRRAERLAIDHPAAQ